MNFNVSKKADRTRDLQFVSESFLPAPQAPAAVTGVVHLLSVPHHVSMVFFWFVFGGFLFWFFVCFISFWFGLVFLLLRLPPSGQGSLQKLLVILGPKPQSPEAGRSPAGPASCAELRAGSIRSSQGVLQEPKQECAGSNLLCFGKTTY